jgi:hypothetical protein
VKLKADNIKGTRIQKPAWWAGGKENMVVNKKKKANDKSKPICKHGSGYSPGQVAKNTLKPKKFTR